MYKEWRTNKSVSFVNSSLCAEFATLYEDKRDVMSDSVRPEWGVSDRARNRRVCVNEWGKVLFCEEVERDEGNRMYRDLVEIGRMWNSNKQRAAFDEWAKNGGEIDDDWMSWVREGQEH